MIPDLSNPLGLLALAWLIGSLGSLVALAGAEYGWDRPRRRQ